MCNGVPAVVEEVPSSGTHFGVLPLFLRVPVCVNLISRRLQTSSRLAASQWLCALHNEVNKRLHKPIFDCAHVDSTYDCGCGDGDEDSTSPPRTKTVESGSGHSEIVEEYDEEEGVHDDLTGIDMIKGGR